jgi:hypothetical protein
MLEKIDERRIPGDDQSERNTRVSRDAPDDDHSVALGHGPAVERTIPGDDQSGRSDQVSRGDPDDDHSSDAGQSISKWEPLVSKIVLYVKTANRLKARCEHVRSSSLLSVQSDEEFWSLYGDALSACPERPRMFLTKRRFVETYGNIHWKPFWQYATRKLHDGTSDPLTKSELFLEMMSIILRTE